MPYSTNTEPYQKTWAKSVNKSQVKGVGINFGFPLYGILGHNKTDLITQNSSCIKSKQILNTLENESNKSQNHSNVNRIIYDY